MRGTTNIMFLEPNQSFEPYMYVVQSQMQIGQIEIGYHRALLAIGTACVLSIHLH